MITKRKITSAKSCEEVYVLINISMFVYLWKNNINGMKYIGKCQSSPDSKYIGSGKHFKRAVAKYGLDNFTRTILETCDNKEHLRQREKYWLDYYDVSNNPEFYNISANSGGGHHGADYSGTNNPMSGRKHPNHKPHFGKENGMYGVRRFRSENPNAREVKITDPNGRIYEAKCLKDACEDIFGNLNHYGKLKHLMKKCSQGKALRSDSTFYGWSGEYK